MLQKKLIVCPNCHRVLSCSCGLTRTRRGTQCCKNCVRELEKKENRQTLD